MIELTVNGKKHSVDVEPEMPLLWVLRDVLDVKGPKFGCGIAQCGACTVHLNGEPVRSCSVPVSAAAGQKVLTIEGLAQRGQLHPVQKAWICARARRPEHGSSRVRGARGAVRALLGTVRCWNWRVTCRDGPSDAPCRALA